MQEITARVARLRSGGRWYLLGTTSKISLIFDMAGGLRGRGLRGCFFFRWKMTKQTAGLCCPLCCSTWKYEVQPLSCFLLLVPSSCCFLGFFGGGGFGHTCFLLRSSRRSTGRGWFRGRGREVLGFRERWRGLRVGNGERRMKKWGESLANSWCCSIGVRLPYPTIRVHQFWVAIASLL